MKCEECLPLIEEYVDGELDGRTMKRLGAHLSACAACADELAALGREQEIYAGYRRDLEVTPADWNIVRARIEQERDAAAPPSESRAPWRERLGVLFGRGLRPAFVAALVVAAVAVAALVVYQRSRNRQGQVAVQPQTRKEERAPEVVEGQATPGERKEIKGGGDGSAPLVAGNNTGTVDPRPTFDVKFCKTSLSDKF